MLPACYGVRDVTRPRFLLLLTCMNIHSPLYLDTQTVFSVPLISHYTLKGRVNLGDIGVDGRIMLKLILKKLDIRALFVLALYWVQSRDLMNTVINDRVE
jgi:hypothetical protein